MLGQWLPRRQNDPSHSQVTTLTAADVAQLDLGWRSMFTADNLRQHVLHHPQRSFWLPATREYVVGGYWRRRREIGNLIELGARGEHRQILTQALLDACASDGCPLVIFSDTAELRHQRWYQSLGFELVQEIIVYELHGPSTFRPSPSPRLRFEVADEQQMEELLVVDHAAFPFLWWNCQAEFENYLDQGGVHVFLGRNREGVALAYAGITIYQGWGHLDRLAVVPGYQGQGYGLETLAFAVAQVHASGARRMGLSTQADNHRSQELYEHFGFRRTYRTDYNLYGHWLVADKAARKAVLSRNGS